MADGDHRALADRPPWHEGPSWARRICATQRLESFGGLVVRGKDMEQLAVELEERAEESIAQPDDTSDDRVEDRLDVRLRPADHPEDLARCRLLVQRGGPLAVLLPQL